MVSVGASGDSSQGNEDEFRSIILFQKLELKAEDEVMGAVLMEKKKKKKKKKKQQQQQQLLCPPMIFPLT